MLPRMLTRFLERILGNPVFRYLIIEICEVHFFSEIYFPDLKFCVYISSLSTRVVPG